MRMLNIIKSAICTAHIMSIELKIKDFIPVKGADTFYKRNKIRNMSGDDLKRLHAIDKVKLFTHLGYHLGITFIPIGYAGYVIADYTLNYLRSLS